MAMACVETLLDLAPELLDQEPLVNALIMDGLTDSDDMRMLANQVQRPL